MRIDLQYANALAPGSQLPVDLDLDPLGVPGLSHLIDVQAAGLLDIQAGVTLDLSLGLDLGDPANPRPFLYDSSSVAATLGVEGNGIQFTSSLGALGIFIGSDTDGGTVALDVDGSGASTAPAELALGLSDADGNGVHYFTEDVTADLTTSLTGSADANLPVFFPTQADPLSPDISIHVADLSDPIGSFSYTAPDFGAIISSLDLTDSLAGLIGGWSGMLSLLEQALSGEVLGVQLPLIGDKLIDASRFVRYLREDVVSALENQADKTATNTQQKIYETLGPAGWNWLGDSTGDGLITIDDVKLTVSPEEVNFGIKLASDFVLFEQPFDLDLGVDGLGLDVDGKVTARVGFDFDFGFGISRNDGVYFDVSDPDEMNVFFDVGLQSVSATGELLFLQLDAASLSAADLTQAQRDATNDVINAFQGSFAIDIADPGTVANDGRLTLAELAGVSDYAQIIDARLSADASMHLDLLASLAGEAKFPSVGAQLHLYWTFSDSTDYDLAAPAVVFSDIRLNLGEFLSGMLGDTFSEINDIIDPVRPILDTITAPIPVISDLFGHDVSLVDIARMFGYGDVADYVEAVDTISDLLATSGLSGDLWINLGGYALTGFDPAHDDIANYDLGMASPDSAAVGYDLDSAVAALGDGDASAYLASARHLNDGSGGSMALAGTGSDRLEMPLITNPLSAWGCSWVGRTSSWSPMTCRSSTSTSPTASSSPSPGRSVSD